MRLDEAVRKVWGQNLDDTSQADDDCVAWAFAGCVDILACLNVLAGKNEQHSWELRTAPEAIHALSRREYGDGSAPGISGVAAANAADAVRRGGTLSRGAVTAFDGDPDYQGSRSARDAIANGYPVAVSTR